MWKKQFVKMMFPIYSDDLMIDEAMALKYKHIPSSLYKYYRFDEEQRSLSNLSNNVVYLSDPNKFNDPFDSMFTISHQKIVNEGLKEELSKGTSAFIEIHKLSADKIHDIINSDDILLEVTKIGFEKYASKNPDGTGKYERKERR